MPIRVKVFKVYFFWIQFIQVIDNFHIILNSKYSSIVLTLFKVLKVCLFWIQFICNLYYNVYMFDETSAVFHGLFACPWLVYIKTRIFLIKPSNMQDFFKTSKLKSCARTNITIPYRTRGKLKKYRSRAFSYQSSTLKMSYHELRAILIIMKAVVVFQSSKQKICFFVDW